MTMPSGWTRLRELSAHEWSIGLILALLGLILAVSYLGAYTLGLATLRELLR